MTPSFGVTLQPDARYLELLDPLFAEADHFEVAPETTWRRDADGSWQPNGFARAFLDLGERHRKPFVAHAVAGSFGTADPGDRERQHAWQRRLAADHAAFAFRWLTDHLGAAVLGDRAVALPIALPHTADAAAVVRARLVALQRVVPDTGVENSAFYFVFGDWRDEPAWLDAVLAAPRTHLLLDLHNVHTMAKNLGVDPHDYLDRLDLTRIIEIHLSGGAESDPRWLPSGRSLRLDSHDAAVPEAVWRLYERTAPRCANLRGVTLERMEGTVTEADVEPLRRELRRAREVLRG